MRVMIVDDERLALQQFMLETEDMPDVETVGRLPILLKHWDL